MKALLLIFVLTLIGCEPLKNLFNTTALVDGFKKRRITLHETIVECINEKGSDALKKIAKENVDVTLGKLLKEAKNVLTKENLKVLNDCRKKAFSELKKNSNFLSFLKKSKKL